jgi:Rap1a immunity proteins
MNRIASAFAASLLVGVLVAWPGRAQAQEMSPPASEWRGYCRAYLEAVDRDVQGNDLDITYCLGVTKGLLNGLRIGSQIGALSFGSRLAIRYELDADEVFKLFQTQEPARLLGICSPTTTPAVDYVRTVLAHLERNPKDLQRPIGEVFFEGLQQAYPCD